MLKTILTHIDFLTEQIDMLDQEIAQRVSSYEEEIERLDSIPGIARRMAEQILAEIGTDVFQLQHIFVRGQLSYLDITKEIRRSSPFKKDK